MNLTKITCQAVRYRMNLPLTISTNQYYVKETLKNLRAKTHMEVNLVLQQALHWYVLANVVAFHALALDPSVAVFCLQTNRDVSLKPKHDILLSQFYLFFDNWTERHLFLTPPINLD